MSFAHLHVHTQFSLLDGACRIEELVSRIKELGQTACAITDHGAMFGAVDFYKAAIKAGIKPLIGCEVYVSPRGRTDKVYEYDAGAYHLVLLCKNEQGYRNLTHMVSLGYTEGFYSRPRIDAELLRAHADGLICLSACIAGQIPQLILSGEYDRARDLALEYKELFGPDGFYLEIQDHGIEDEAAVTAGILRLSRETGIGLVATNDAHYLTKDDADAQDIMLCIQTGKTFDDPGRMRFQGNEFYIKSEDEMRGLFKNHPEALENTQKIADMCDFKFIFNQYHLPKFHVPEEGLDAEQYLEKLSRDGFDRIFPDAGDDYKTRLEFELQMIKKTGFVDYFLIVADFIAYAKGMGIPVGPGRGSGAGSIVAYCLGITGIDPVKYSLYFERFLNPERISMPDFDIDFCPRSRQKVIDYVVEKYGVSNVAQIITFGTMQAKGAIRDVGRVLGVPIPEVDAISRMVPFGVNMTLENALNISPNLAESYETDEKVKKIIDTARRLEGMPRNSSTHAAGVVITDRPVSDYIPLATNNETVVTQYTMKTVEELGLLKIDFLGLRNLTVIYDTEKMVRAFKPDFSIGSLPDDDAQTYAMISAGKTAGVFQLESPGMTNVAVGLAAQSIEEITALIALYRPGPMESIPRFIEGKHNPDKVRYAHPLLEDILRITYGCIVYQEQVMEVFRKLAGYSLGRADIVRRAMSGKRMDVLKLERENFISGNEEAGIEGCLRRGVDDKTANKLFDEILDFANYAFNKAHAACYAVISYQTAYLKCHYPREYMSALLTSVLDSTVSVANYINECRLVGIRVLPPDINKSGAYFTPDGDNIRFGMDAIKNAGSAAVEKIVAEREQNGPFSDFFDLVGRTLGCGMNKRMMEGLVKAGACDSLGMKRSQMLIMYETAAEQAAERAKRIMSGQMSLFGAGADEEIDTRPYVPPMDEFTPREMLAMEKESIGIFLSGHPMDEYDEAINRLGAIQISDINDEYAASQAQALDEETMFEAEMEGREKRYGDGQRVMLAGLVSDFKTKTTKNGSLMAYMTLEDKSGAMECMVFSKTLTDFGGFIRDDNAVFVKGRITAREGEMPKLICESAELISAAYEKFMATVKQKKQKLYIKVTENNRDGLDRIKSLIRLFPGDMDIILYYEQSGRREAVARELRVSPDGRMLLEMRELMGEENIKIN